MTKLADTLQDAAKRKALIQDCVQVIDEEVQSKGGLSGMAVKAAYRVVKGVKPGFVAEAVDGLINDFANNLQPMVDEAEEKGTPVAAHLGTQSSRVADAMLSITDRRAERSKHAMVRGTYLKLRPTAKKHVEEAVPRVAALIDKYAA